MILAQPLLALREVSRDPTYRWLVTMIDGSTMSSIDLHREYLRYGQRYRGETTQTDWILDNWAMVLDGLEKDPMAMGQYVDWVAKRQIVEQYIEEEGYEWGDDALYSADLEYHNIDPKQSLFYAWQEMGKTKRLLKDVDIVMAMTDPPQNTRAKGRSKLVEKVLERKKPSKFYLFDWNGVALDRHTYIEMPDPFNTYDS